MNHVLVTGGAGFIGSHLVERLLARGDRVRVIDDESTGSLENLREVREHANLEILRGSVANGRLVREAVAEVDEVYHLAAAVGVALIAREPLRTIETNIAPTQLLLDELRRRYLATSETARFFLASTSEVYGKNPKPRWTEEDDLVFGPTSKPRWSYGASKAIDEFLALAYGREGNLPVTIGRFFNVVGPRQTGAFGMVLPRFVTAAVQGKPLQVHDDGKQTRCFAHVADVIDAVLGLMRHPSAAGRVYNIGSDEPLAILDLAKLVVEVAGSKSPIEFQSYNEAYDSDFEDVRVRAPDTTRLRTTIQWKPTRGVRAIIEELVEMERKKIRGVVE